LTPHDHAFEHAAALGRLLESFAHYDPAETGALSDELLLRELRVYGSLSAVVLEHVRVVHEEYGHRWVARMAAEALAQKVSA